MQSLFSFSSFLWFSEHLSPFAPPPLGPGATRNKALRRRDLYPFACLGSYKKKKLLIFPESLTFIYFLFFATGRFKLLYTWTRDEEVGPTSSFFIQMNPIWPQTLSLRSTIFLFFSVRPFSITNPAPTAPSTRWAVNRWLVWGRAPRRPLCSVTPSAMFTASCGVRLDLAGVGVELWPEYHPVSVVWVV